MGQLQKRFEQQNQAAFTESPEATLQWKNSGKRPVSSVATAQPKNLLVPRWQIRAVQVGGIIIVVLALILLLG